MLISLNDYRRDSSAILHTKNYTRIMHKNFINLWSMNRCLGTPGSFEKKKHEL